MCSLSLSLGTTKEQRNPLFRTLALFPVLYRPRVAEAGSAPSSSRRPTVEVEDPDPESSPRTTFDRELVETFTSDWKPEYHAPARVRIEFAPAGPPCASSTPSLPSGYGAGTRCGEFHLPEWTGAEILLGSAAPVPGWLLGETVVRQSGRAVQGVSAASRVAAQGEYGCASAPVWLHSADRHTRDGLQGRTTRIILRIVDFLDQVMCTYLLGRFIFTQSVTFTSAWWLQGAAAFLLITSTSDYIIHWISSWAGN